MKFIVYISFILTTLNAYADFRVLRENIRGSKITYYDMDNDEIIDYVFEETRDSTISYWKDGEDLHKAIKSVKHRKMIDESYILRPETRSLN